MKGYFLQKTLSFITQYKDYTSDEIEKLQYGLEGIYLTITKAIIILAISFILGILKETLIILLFFNILRFTGFGFHAEKSIHCLILSTFLFSILPYCLLRVELNPLLEYGMIVISLISFILYAPADTPKRPLPNKRKRIIRKCGTLIIASIYVLVIILVEDLELSLLLNISLFIEAIMVHPITYKIFRQSYRNYKNYSVV